MGKESIRRFKDTEEDDSSVVTRGRRQRGAEVEMKRLMGGAPEVVSTIQANPNTDLEIPQEVVVKNEPWLRPGVIESALMPRIVPPAANDATSAEADEEALGKVLGNDIWNKLSNPEELQKLEGSKIPEEISQIYGDQTPPFGVLELYKRLNAEKRAEYITDLRIFEDQNKQQKAPEIVPVAAVLEAEEQVQIDQNIEASRTVAAPEIPTLTDVVSEEELKNVGKETKASNLEGFGSIVANPEDAIDQDPMREIFSTEGTPREWRDKLRGLIEGAKEKVSWYKSSEEKLIRRNAELDAEVEKIGGVERLFRTMGEKYNKLGWKSKIAVGTSLGLGAAFSAGVSMPIALACLSGIAAQRIAGLSTMYLKFEKKSHEEAWGKEKAFLKAAVYTAVMGLAIKEGIEYVSETESAHVVQKWLGETLGHFSLSGATHAPAHPAEVPKISASAPEVATQSVAVASAPEVPHPAAAAAADGEVAAPAIASEIPGIEVTATPGHGYEYMMKRLWEQLQEKHIQLPANANPDSDLAQLLRADEKTIDGVVHKLAQDNEFFKGDGTSAHINLDSKLTIDTKGQIWLDHENIIAPEESTVSAPQAEAPLAPVPHTEVAPSEIGNGEDVTSAQNAIPVETEKVVSPAWEQDYSGQETPISVETHEAPVSTPASIENVIPNKFGLTIPTAETHIYANEARSLFVYGGSVEQKMKMITEYLTNNPDRVIYAEDVNHNRVPWLRELGGQGKIIQGPVMRTSGLAGIFTSFMEAPSPNDFKTLVK